MTLARFRLGLVAAIATSSLVSIFAAQVLLGVAIAAHLLAVVRKQVPLRRLPLDGPILAFSVWTLLSASFSQDPVASHEEAKKLILFALLYVAVDCLGREAARERIVAATLLGGVALAAGSILQYHFLGFDTLNNRPVSFLGHYMTTAGLCMGVLLLASARLTFRPPAAITLDRADGIMAIALFTMLGVLTVLEARNVFPIEATRLFVAGLALAAFRIAVSTGSWPSTATTNALAALAVPLTGWALLLSRTRSAWLGALAGLGAIAVLRAPRLLWLLPAGVGAILILRPAPVIDRLTWTDASSRDRYYMWQAGIDMIGAKPLFGQGPGRVQDVYPAYRWPAAPNPAAPHLHDNVLQIAAERGLPGLALWLWLVAVVLADAYREARRGVAGPGWAAGAALAVIVALLVAGLFEYNFGDSEILMFILLLSAFPYALRRERTGLTA